VGDKRRGGVKGERGGERREEVREEEQEEQGGLESLGSHRTG
jgi:hypothetical protein